MKLIHADCGVRHIFMNPVFKYGLTSVCRKIMLVNYIVRP